MKHQVKVIITNSNYSMIETVVTISLNDKDTETEIDDKIMKRAERFCKSRGWELEMWELADNE